MNSNNLITLETIDLTNCDREPIHIPGQIQPHGVLIAFQAPQLTILQISQNIESWLDISPEALIGQNLSVLFSDAQVEQMTTYLEHDNLNLFNPFEITFLPHWIDPDRPHLALLSWEQGHSQTTSSLPLRETSEERAAENSTRSQLFKGILHRSQGLVVLELEPCDSINTHSLLGFYPLLCQAISSIRNATDIANLTEIIVQEVRQVTNCDRVMVYRFEADHSGVVVAEAKRDDLDSYLGLHYPASDIPVQARKLYYEKWLRIIPNVPYQPAKLVPTLNPLTHQPLDLSAAVLRSVSPLHMEYLQNMGVVASMSISLITEKRLWGLIACHHYTPKYVDYETRQACEFLGQIASVELVHQQDRAAKRYKEEVKSIQDQFHQAFTKEPGFIEQILHRNQSALLNLVKAQGAAIVLDNQLTLVGQAPSQSDTRALMLWLLSQDQQELFYTNALTQLHPEAKRFKDIASGILAISIFLNQKSYHIIWFRPEQIQTVRWAGNPSKPVSVSTNGEVRLSPRRSFDLWKETVQDKSFPWQLLELEAAQEMRNTLMLAALEFSQVALEQAAERAEIANRAKSQFLAKMSHELRTPLNAILGFAQIMSRDRTLSQEFSEHLGIITRSGEHLLVLINDVLEMSKIEAGQLTLKQTCFDLHRLIYAIKDLFRLRASDKGLKFSIEQACDLPQYVCGDEDKLRQILINLVGNAVKFTTDGQVTLRVSMREWADGRAAASPHPPSLPSLHSPHSIPCTIFFEVEDTGPGIAPEEIPFIFEAFMQTERGRYEQGTGLGLSISRQFARLMGGDITVQSMLSQGSIFSCCVQLTATDAIDTLSIAAPRRIIGLEPDQPHYRILIVEDILENRQLLVKLLELLGFAVRSVENGLDAISCWADWHPHLILMDIQMPVMNGHEATRQIRAAEQNRGGARNVEGDRVDGENREALASPPSPPTIIIALTANAFEEDRKAALQSGCDDYVAKPFAETTLLDKLAQHLGLRYLYAEAEPLESPRSSLTQQEQLPTQRHQILPQDLQIMPPDWIANVRQAARVIDEVTLHKLINQIPAQEQPLANALRRLVDDFHFEAIVELTQS